MPLITDEVHETPGLDRPAPLVGKPVANVPRGQPRRIGALQRALALASVGLNEVFGARGREGFGILMYHRITKPVTGFPLPTWNVSPGKFAKQLRGLLRRGWQPRSLREVLISHKQGLSLPRKTFVVTFDDGYENNLLNALPVLEQLRIPATIFLATAYLDSDQPFPSDDWSAAGDPGVPAETWRPLSTEQCRELSASGLVELAAHTHTHADFRGRPQDLVADLHECRSVLFDRFGFADATFAFPYGTKASGFSGGALAIAARQAGVLCSLTTEGQLVRPGDDPFDWGRFAAEQHDTAATLAAKLGGWHTAVRTLGKSLIGRSR